MKLNYFGFGVLGLVITAVIFISGCVQSPVMKDCGEDKSCFKEAVLSCSPAKVKLIRESAEVTMNWSGIGIEKTGEWEVIGIIKEKVGDSCKIVYEHFTSKGQDLECIIKNVGYDGWPTEDAVKNDCRIIS